MSAGLTLATLRRALLLVSLLVAGPGLAEGQADGLAAGQGGEPTAAGGALAAARAAIERGEGSAARSLLRPLARQGQVEAQYWLGRAYFYELSGVNRDFGRAAYWWRRAAAAGHADAQYKLGGLYFAGRGVAQDDAQAAHWWRAAARQRQPEAMNNLGALLANGRGLPADAVLAYALQALSVELGNTLAAENLRRKEETLSPTSLAEAQQLAEALRDAARLWQALDALAVVEPQRSAHRSGRR